MWVNPIPSTASAYALMAPGALPISVCGRTTPIFMERPPSFGEGAPSEGSPLPLLAATRHGAGRQRLDVGVDVALAREPHAVTMLEDVLQGAAQTADAVRPAEHEGMQRDRAHQRLARRLREHLVELV